MITQPLPICLVLYLQSLLVAVAAGALQIDRIDGLREVIEGCGGGALEGATPLTLLAQEHLPAQHQRITRLAVSIHLLCGQHWIQQVSLTLSLSPPPSF